MIVINECRITEDGRCLIIEASVDSLSYYKNVFIDQVIIDTDSTFSINGPSSSPIYQKSFTGGNLKVGLYNNCDKVTDEQDCECGNIYVDEKYGIKNIRLRIPCKELGLSTLDDNIFFVYIYATGYPDPGTPCGMDNKYTMGIAYNLRPIYNKAMGYIRELDSNCDIPKGLIDMILRMKAFELAMRTGHFTVAFEHWNTLFKNKVSVSIGKNCGCNGINR